MREMFAADPDFAMGTIMTNTMELFGVPPSQAEQPRQKLVTLSTSSQAATLTQLEKYHLEAGLLLAQEDYKVGGLDFIMTLVFILYCFTLFLCYQGAMDRFEDILRKYPRDAYALQMAYFLALTTGHTAKLR